MKKFASLLFVSLIVFGIFSGCKIDTETSPKNNNSTNTASKDIKITSPLPNDIIKNPLKITGEAKGTWFFEGSFPIELLDSEGNRLAEGFAQTKENWMTEEFVPFTASLNFENPKTEAGTLLIHKDNPSGLKENDKSIEIPIRFSQKNSSPQ
ncbi:MAG: Gmad2 immunoglobulin-like domain-containing protein [Candidatus Gracilibacteria bacterium]|nr:Gmad2 immunoglobulin-like domain-containing protein [Candidatus Gracilibacteria bacterium]